MNQLSPSNNHVQQTELKFLKDWMQSYGLILQAIKETPIASAILVTASAMSVNYPQVALAWLLIITVSWFFVAAKLNRLTYCQILPEAQNHPELFPKRPEWQMFGAQWLFNVGTILCSLLLILPGIWFAIVHSLAQQFVIFEGCTAEKAFTRSRELMKGNILNLLSYALLWPTIISVAVYIGLIICNIVIHLILKFALQIDATKTEIYVMQLIFTYFNLLMYMSGTTLMARAYVQFTHKSGSLTAIEKELAPEIAMQ